MGISKHMEREDTLRSKYLLFSMGSETYGIEIRYITEIIGIQPITTMPDMPEYVRGVTNLRGKIIPVMDARLRFKKKAQDYDDRTCIIVLNLYQVSVGLIVDNVSDVLTIQEENVVAPPEINGKGHSFIKGIGKADGNIQLLLDCQKLLTDEETEKLCDIA